MLDLPHSIFHVIFLVPDMDRSLSFYRDVLDFKVLQEERDFELVPGSGRMVSFALLERADEVHGVVELATTPELKPKPVSSSASNEVGFWAVVFDVENIDQVYHEWKSRGVDFINEPTLQNVPNWGKLYSAVMMDIDGNRIELVQLLFDRQLIRTGRKLRKE